MDESKIGIKIADGTFFPILEGYGKGKKRLVLTTVNDDQSSVQIDLYKGSGENIEEASYVGSLVIEDIIPAQKGVPEIELLIGIDENGNLNAEAGDTGVEERQSLSVSLESLDEDSFSTPNFEIDETAFEEVPSFEDEELDDDLDFEDAGLDSAPEMDESELDSEPDLDMSELDDDLDFDESALGTEPDLDMSELDDDFDFNETELGSEPELGDSVPDDDIDFDESALGDDIDFDESTLDGEPDFDDSLNLDMTEELEEEPAINDMPEFDEFDQTIEDDFGQDFDEQLDQDRYEEEEEENAPPEENEGRRNPLAIAVLIILILAILGIGAFFIIKSMSGDSIPELRAGNEAPADENAAADDLADAEPEPEPEPEVTAAPEVPEQAPENVPETVVQEPEEPEAAAAPEISEDSGSQVSSSAVPPEGSGGGVWYRLKWGDTLWDLSNSFYRTPWLYKIIAVENSIRNPDLIYAGDDIHIPEN